MSDAKSTNLVAADRVAARSSAEAGIGSGVGSGTGPGAAPPEPSERDSVELLGRHAAGGASKTLAAALLQKLLSSVVLVVIGWYLDDKDMGQYSTALAVAGFMNLLRDGGASSMLIQRGHKVYEKVAGPLFRLSLGVNLLSAALIAVLAWPLAHYGYKDPGLAPLLWVFAITGPFMVPGSILLAKMNLDLRFGDLSRLSIITGFFRQIVTVVLLMLGFKTMALALTGLLGAIADGVLAYRATRDRVWERPARWRDVPSYLRMGSWTVVGLFANLALDQGAIAVMSILLRQRLGSESATSEIGVFSFAFQVAAQAGVLLSYGLQQVMFPVLARLNEEPDRQRVAMVRALQAIMILGSVACLGLSVTMHPLEKMVWHGKWDASVLAVMILGAFYPWRITFGLTNAILFAQGRFKRQALLTTFEGVCTVGAAAAACLIPDKPGAISTAWCVGGTLMLTRIIVTAHVLKIVGLERRQMALATVPAWLAALAAGFAALQIDNALKSAGWTMAHLRASGLIGGERTIETLGYAVSFLIRGTICVVIFAALVRTFMAGPLADAVSTAPERIGTLARRVLFLRAPGEESR